MKLEHITIEVIWTLTRSWLPHTLPLQSNCLIQGFHLPPCTKCFVPFHCSVLWTVKLQFTAKIQSHYTEICSFFTVCICCTEAYLKSGKNKQPATHMIPALPVTTFCLLLPPSPSCFSSIIHLLHAVYQPDWKPWKKFFSRSKHVRFLPLRQAHPGLCNRSIKAV